MSAEFSGRLGSNRFAFSTYRLSPVVTGRLLFHLLEWVFVLAGASASQRNVDSVVIEQRIRLRAACRARWELPLRL